MPIIFLNYTHPLTAEQAAQLAALLGERPEERRVAVQVDRARPLAQVARELADAAALAPEEWQTGALLVNPPALAPVALALAAELHGRCGYFPAMVNVRPIAGANPPRYEIAEVVNLQAIRDQARMRR